MRILKYLFLLLLLFLVAVTVFVATQKDTYQIERSHFVKLPKSVVYSYVSDFKNWEQFGNWQQNEGNTFNYPAVTSGKNAHLNWSNATSTGKITNINIKANQSIQQELDYNGALSKMNWTFKDSLGGTKITWQAKGRMPFKFKVSAITSGGVDKLMGAIIEQSLNDLDRTLNKEISSKKISEPKLVDIPAVGYIKQSITSKISDLPSNIRIMLARMNYFFKKNNIKASGAPFVVYETYDTQKGLCRFSVCMPVDQEIFIAEGSDMRFGKMPSLRAVQVTLNGDVSHIEEARKVARKYVNDKAYTILPKYKWIEKVEVGMAKTNRPSEWITQVLIPTGTVLATPTPTEETAPISTTRPTSTTNTSTRPATASENSTPN